MYTFNKSLNIFCSVVTSFPLIHMEMRYHTMELPIRPLHCATAHFFHMVNYLYLYMSIPYSKEGNLFNINHLIISNFFAPFYNM